MPIVSLDGAVVLLGQFPALAGLDFTAERGQAVLLHGPNGAGKSTLLRLCAGLLRLEQGRGHVLGFDLSVDRRAVRRRVALVGHRTMLYDDLTVHENLILGAYSDHARNDERSRSMKDRHRRELGISFPAFGVIART